ncbi:MAG: sodium:solute symporter [Methyloceanibacter sp.]|uniref:monocarboxylate uptake permease MctP n=1 Tax=Methyloceanibacter sp. TaxID=1965321 RepID=UPI001DE7E80A|nr:sodium:solute symporter [Methyloceanibacter sp.]MCB1443273.1 sodium:solute symporter [Methyloceanibacter sp.]MCC0058178.1 sodium:solute symporter [Hyphomicrobiaceae bacterium]
MTLNVTATIVFVALFLFVTWIGFIAARWRKADLDQLHEWGLGGRRFGTIVTWFLLGGDLYTAYTFIAVPALVFGVGAMGFFAVPYTVMIYPILFLVFPRLWVIARREGHVTAADYVRARFNSRLLALAVALTGLLATMPYIALQLVGMEVVIGALGFPTHGIVGHIPLIIAFVVLAAFTYTSGLRAPALIAVVKDMLIFITIFAAIVIIPAKLGGYGAIFDAVPEAKLTLRPPAEGSLGDYSAYITLALGSACALFLYPHAMTGILSASSGHVIRRNAAALSAYSFVLGLIALLGYMAIAAGVDKNPLHASGFERYGANFAVPALFLDMFPSWFAGVAFAAVAIGALVPAAIMSIACANLFTRNIYKEYWRPDCTDAQEAKVAKIVSLVVKVGAVVFVLAIPHSYAIQLQLLGGIWIIQLLPPILLGLFARGLNARALLLGWAIGTAVGTYMAATRGFVSSIYPLEVFGLTIPGYAALYSVVLNFAVAVALSPVLDRVWPQRGALDPASNRR